MKLQEGILKAYERAGKALDKLRLRKMDYGITFNTIPGQRVLMDLASFCRAAEPCFDPDARKHALAEGRREVWLRIQRHLQLNTEELFQLYAQRSLPDRVTPQETDDE